MGLGRERDAFCDGLSRACVRAAHRARDLHIATREVVLHTRCFGIVFAIVRLRFGSFGCHFAVFNLHYHSVTHQWDRPSGITSGTTHIVQGASRSSNNTTYKRASCIKARTNAGGHESRHSRRQNAFDATGSAVAPSPRSGKLRNDRVIVGATAGRKPRVWMGSEEGQGKVS